MTEDDAKQWIASRYPAERVELLEHFAVMLTAATTGQNLIAPSTLSTLWSRHLLDSAQLIDLAPDAWRHWVDIGSGAGLPGLVIAILTDKAVTLVEPRRLRAAFLDHCRNVLQLSAVVTLQTRAESASIDRTVDVISARAVAKLDALFRASRGFAIKDTTYILPKGATAKSEVAAAQRSWQGVFHVEQSIVDPKSGIVVATGVAPR